MSPAGTVADGLELIAKSVAAAHPPEMRAALGINLRALAAEVRRMERALDEVYANAREQDAMDRRQAALKVVPFPRMRAVLRLVEQGGAA